MNNPLTVILAAGGTGGHVFPAEALADELKQRGVRVVLITDKRFGTYSGTAYQGALKDVETHTIHAGGLGSGLARRFGAAMNIVRGIMQARSIIKRIKPDVVVGFGGYPSFPTMLAAGITGVPTLIHEQNAVLGRANRVLAPRVDGIATTFDHTLMIRSADNHKVVVTGNPVRAAIRVLHDVPYPELSQDGSMRLLVMGGSQGALIFGKILPAAIAALPAALRARIRIDQQCRPEDIDATRAAYTDMGASADLATFFTDVPARLASAHLVIARAGASTVAELAAAGRPAVLVPYPSAMDDHQNHNANAVEDAGAGWLMPQEGFTATALSARIESFLNLPATLTRAAANARASGRIYATRDLADLAVKLAKGNSPRTEQKMEHAA